MTPPYNRAEFVEHRLARRGSANPELMDVRVWKSLVRTRVSAYTAASEMGAPTGPGSGAGWCFQRFGCSKTRLADGRVIRIAGEHEDHYDPDFFIYNDVVVLGPDGEVDIYGYPEDVFPPTDFHTATLVGDEIYVIGSLGYPDQRRYDTTQVLRLDPSTFQVASASSASEGCPGWIHSHTAKLSPDGEQIIVQRGIVVRSAASDGRHVEFVDNIDDWAYRPSDGSWQRLTRRPWQQWRVGRRDGDPLCLFEMGNIAFELEIGSSPEQVALEALGARRFDPETYAVLFEPPVDHEPRERDWSDEDEDEDDDGYRPGDNTRYDHAQIAVGDALVRYAPGHREVVIKLEGTIGEAVARALVDDLTSKLARLQDSPCDAELVDRA